MADLSKIKVGDRLRIEVEVQEIRDEPLRIRVRHAHNEYGWLWPDIESSAEHIPAPRTFKRGDLVKRRLDGGWEVGGLVLGGSRTDVGKLQGYLRVDWPGAGVGEHHPSVLEHCEAPDA